MMVQVKAAKLKTMPIGTMARLKTKGGTLDGSIVMMGKYRVFRIAGGKWAGTCRPITDCEGDVWEVEASEQKHGAGR